MRRLFVFAALMAVMTIADAQIKVAEPEFVNSYCILTSDSTFDVLPKENGSIGEHQNKAKKLLGKIGKVANLAAAAGIAGAHIGISRGNLGGALTGIKVAGSASSVANLADASSVLAGAAGMDIIFQGKESPYTFKYQGGDIRLLIKAENNEVDPMGIFRIVRFNTSKKERRVQWLEFEAAVLDEDEAKKGGYVNFTGQKYGVQSYLLTIPAAEVESGEFGIFFLSVGTASAIPVGTYSVKHY